MTKIILFPERNISDIEGEMTYSFKLDSLSLEEAVYLYKDSDSNKVMCFPNELENGELISVDMLSDKEVHSEIKVMSIYGEILEYGWRDVLNKGVALICKEGAFIWDQVAKEFILVGKIRWSMTVRKVKIQKDFLVKLKNTETFYEQGEEFNLMDKFTYQDENGTEGNMLVISGDREEHWAIPEDFNYIKLGIQNLVMIC